MGGIFVNVSGLHIDSSTLPLDSSIVSRHCIYSLLVPSGALPLVSHTECHLMTLTPEVHNLLYQTLGLTLYSCLYFSGLDSSTGLLYSKQTSYLLSFSPFRCSTSCLPHGVPSDDSDSRGTHTLLYQTLWLTLYFCLYFSGLDSSTGLLYSKQTSYLLSFCPFRCSTSCLPHGVPSDDSDSRGTQSSIPNTWINTLFLSLL